MHYEYDTTRNLIEVIFTDQSCAVVAQMLNSPTTNVIDPSVPGEPTRFFIAFGQKCRATNR